MRAASLTEKVVDDRALVLEVPLRDVVRPLAATALPIPKPAVQPEAQPARAARAGVVRIIALAAQAMSRLE